jgi:hypothetical protein
MLNVMRSPGQTGEPSDGGRPRETVTEVPGFKKRLATAYSPATSR